jgi:hypothetical protein
MKKLIEKWKSRKKKVVILPEKEIEESWLGGEAMIHQIIEEKNLKQKNKRRLKE